MAMTQGSALNSLFTAVIGSVTNEVKPKSSWTVMFADDIVTWSETIVFVQNLQSMEALDSYEWIDAGVVTRRQVD